VFVLAHSQTFPVGDSTAVLLAASLILLSGLRNALHSPVGSGAKSWPQAHFYAFQAQKFHLVVTFLIIRIHCFLVLADGVFDQTHHTTLGTGLMYFNQILYVFRFLFWSLC